MIIHQPEIIRANGEIVVSARIESSRSIPNLPRELWFAFPEKYEPWLCDRSDAFLNSMIKPAMVFNESLEVRGTVSPLLAYNIEEYQRIYKSWFPNVLSIIDMKFQETNPLSETGSLNVISTCFSGGVDSFFTLWSHLPENQPLDVRKISHLIYIQGVDTPHAKMEIYERLTKKFQSISDQFGIDLISARTNAREFSEPWFPWTQMYNAAVIGIPLVLEKLIEIHYVPSGMTYSHSYPYGCTPMTDHLLSTETLKIIHHGAYYTRVEKIDKIGDWEIAQKNLRVCIAPENCSSCDKCYRTMTMLKVTDYLYKFEVFKQPFRYLEILRWGFEYRTMSYQLRWTMSYVNKHRKWKYIPALVAVFLMWRIKLIAIAILPEFIKEQIKKLIYPPREWASLVENSKF